MKETMRWKMKWKILKMLWNILYKTIGNLLCQLYKKYCKQLSSLRKTKRNGLMLLLNCVTCSKKKSKFIKNKEAGRLELQ